MAAASYTYLPWVRLGLASMIRTVETLDGTLPGRAVLPVQLNVELGGTTTVTTPPVDVVLRGPGDVVALDPAEVLRTDPPDGSVDVEPNYLPVVEFARADLPWMFTPALSDVQSRLRPWMVLIVVENRPGVRIESGGSGHPDRLVIDDGAAAELPDLADSWAWGHVQVSGPVGGSEALKTLLINSPNLVLSRLMCPRFLTANTQWTACLVPAFESGRKAGLRLPLDAAAFDDLQPSWLGTEDSITLPLYHHWSFTTGPSGDFETLARRLLPFPMPPTVGVRDLDVGHAGSGLPEGMDGADRLTQYRGALVSPAAPPDPWDPAHRVPFEAALATALSLGVQPDGIADPVVAPPLYGRWHAAVDELPGPGGEPPWVRDLNLHPANRAAAGLGTDVVRARQEALMQSAWEQVGDLLAVNQVLRQAQLAREANVSARTRHFDTLPSDDARVQMASPMLPRTPLASGGTAFGEVRASALPDGTVSAAFRRVARPLGPASTHTGASNADWAGRVLTELADPASSLSTANELVTPRGMGSTTHIALLAPVPGSNDDDLAELATVLPGFSNFLGNYSEAPAPDADLVEIRTAVAATLDAPAALLAHVQSKVLVKADSGRDDWARAEPFDPILAAPEFAWPMYKTLPTQWLVPGVDAMPFDSVGILEANPAFVESFMLGLNHEMACELLWREYPTDQRGTYFRQFWDVSGAIPAPTDEAAVEAAKDIPPIHTWAATATLGASVSGAGANPDGVVVVLIRGELLRRYPNTIVYLVRAAWSANQRIPKLVLGAEEQEFPLFTGRLDNDTHFFGFGVPAEAVAGGGLPEAGNPNPDAGWFVAFQQQPTEPRFGMDDDPAAPLLADLTEWEDLAWQSIGAAPGAFVSLSTIASSHQAEGTTWGRNGAHMARIMMQTPARVLFHGSALLLTAGS